MKQFRHGLIGRTYARKPFSREGKTSTSTDLHRILHTPHLPVLHAILLYSWPIHDRLLTEAVPSVGQIVKLMSDDLREPDKSSYLAQMPQESFGM